MDEFHTVAPERSVDIYNRPDKSSKQSNKDVLLRIYLLHAAGNGNAGDNAQAYAAVERIERTIPNCEVIISKGREWEADSLWGTRQRVPSLQLYISNRWFVLKLTVWILKKVGFNKTSKVLDTLISWSRGWRLVLAARISKFLNFVPLLSPDGRKAIQAIRDCDAVYCSGGGTLNDIWLAHGLVPRAITYRVANILKKPLYISGQGIGPLQSTIGRILLKRGTKHAKVFACRDQTASAKLLTDLGVNRKIVRSLGDDAVDLRESSSSRVSEILHREGISASTNDLICVHIRLKNYTEDFRHRAIPVLAKLFDNIIESKKQRIIFIPISHYINKTYDRDIGDAFEVFSNMRNRRGASFICGERYSPSDMKAIVGACKLLIGFSYHACVFALTSNKPAFGLYTGDYFRLKMTGLFDWYDRTDWVWDIDALDVVNFLSTMQDVLRDYDKHCAHLKDVTERMTRTVQLPVKLMKRHLHT